MRAHATSRWTTSEVRKLIARSPLATPRFELVDGELLVTPSPSDAHQLVVGELFATLREYVNRNGVGLAMVSPSDVALKRGTITQPDVYVLPSAARASRGKRFPARKLLLAVEVVSWSSRRYDRQVKRALYLAHMPEYWTVDYHERCVEVWRAGSDEPEIVTERLTWRPDESAPALEIDLPALFTAALGEPDGPSSPRVRERSQRAYRAGEFDVRAWLAQLPRHGWTVDLLDQLPEQFRFEIIDGELLLPEWAFDAEKSVEENW